MWEELRSAFAHGDVESLNFTASMMEEKRKNRIHYGEFYVVLTQQVG
jgi:hypothetical protein